MTVKRGKTTGGEARGVARAVAKGVDTAGIAHR